MMWKNQHTPGNMAVLVNAPRAGLRTLEDVVEAAGSGLRLSSQRSACSARAPRIASLSSPP